MKTLSKFIIIILFISSQVYLLKTTEPEKKETLEKIISPERLRYTILISYKDPQKLLDNFTKWNNDIEKFQAKQFHKDPRVDENAKTKLATLKDDLKKEFEKGIWCTGKKVLEKIYNESKEETVYIPELNEIVSLIWYFYALAVEQGNPFIEGTFIIEDKNDLIFNALSRGYARISSHLTKTNQHGIDIPEDQREKLFFPPFNPQKKIYKYHILFGQIKSGLIFIKPESYGVKTWGDFTAHALEYLEPRENEALGMKKERIPKNVIDAWNSFLITVFGAEQPSWLAKILAQLGIIQESKIPSNKGTSQIAQKGISAIRQTLDATPEFKDENLTEAQKLAKQNLIKIMDEYGTELERIGNEIILTSKELQEGLKDCSSKI